MAKQKESASDIVNKHKPKNFKYRFIINDDAFYQELIDQGYNLDELDTIHNDALIQEALHASYKCYEQTVIGKAKEPTNMGDGVMLSRKMITKVGKKLSKIGLAFFTFQDTKYVSIRAYYEKFDIIELFILA